MTTASVKQAFRNIEKDAHLSSATRVFGQPFYVSIKDAYYHKLLPAVDTAQVGYRDVFLLFLWGIVSLFRRSSAKTIFFSADVGVSKRSDGVIEDHFAVFPDADNAWHCIAVGSLRGQPSPRELFNAGIFADNILLLPLVLLLRPFIKIAMLLVARREIADLCALFGNYGLVVQPEWVRGVVARDYARYLAYKALIKLLGARTVYLVSACGRSFIVNAVRGIGGITVEIQHGICGPSHRGFNYQCSPDAISAPDFLIVKNEYWRDEVLRAGFFTASQVQVAVPRINSCQECTSGVEPNFLAKVHGGKYIVFTGQPPVVDQICKQIEDVYPFFVNKNIYFIYKFHPADSARVIADIKQRWALYDRVLFIHEKVCINCLLRNAAVHVSYWSTCHHDAVELLGKTFVLALPGASYMDEYCASLPLKFIQIHHLAEVISQIPTQEGL